MDVLWGRRWQGDVIVALAAVVGCVVLGLLGQPDWWWSAAMAATLAVRRTATITFAAAATAVSAAHLLVDAALLFPGDVVLLVAAYSVAAHAHGCRRALGPALGLAFVLVFTGRALAGGTAPAWGSAGLVVGLVVASLVVAWTVGLLERRRVGALRDAEHRRLLSERDADARTQLAAYEERERISDDMHDVLAHTLTNVVVQAESGQAIAPPGEIADLFETISRTSRSALGEVRGLLAPTDHEHTQPTPSLDDLDDLVTGFGASGLQVERSHRGTPTDVSPGLSLAIYRVIQESLTNALRHGTGDHAHLVLDWAPDQITVTVSNPVGADSAQSPVREHRGLAGTRRRCTLYGGSTSFELTDEFTLVASWPLTTTAATRVKAAEPR
ncbi:sensor histidine kinase [Rhodococcus erythropolis]|uniref:sensor histidine kinase n=1 Tax=Rhodococcus erythropolis TaxID=1833 RepID=UPI0008791592|nr:histidine kinase [Rhodococcus erythropolis]OFV73515.1 sensor histidine kinase DesK [Rhodococcus erythropolis]